jgi:hypothetical protein
LAIGRLGDERLVRRPRLAGAVVEAVVDAHVEQLVRLDQVVGQVVLGLDRVDAHRVVVEPIGDQAQRVARLHLDHAERVVHVEWRLGRRGRRQCGRRHRRGWGRRLRGLDDVARRRRRGSAAAGGVAARSDDDEGSGEQHETDGGKHFGQANDTGSPRGGTPGDAPERWLWRGSFA